MIEKYGLDHAPKNPNHRYVALPVKDRKKLAQIYAELFPVTEIAHKRKNVEELSHASNLEHGAKRKKKNPPPSGGNCFHHSHHGHNISSCVHVSSFGGGGECST